MKLLNISDENEASNGVEYYCNEFRALLSNRDDNEGPNKFAELLLEDDTIKQEILLNCIE